MCITLITASLNLGAGHPTGAGHAEATENDDGADPLPVHFRIPSSHSVPEKLKAHISSHNFLRGPDHVKRLQREKSACRTHAPSSTRCTWNATSGRK